jgi:hypothetical protein
MKTDDPKLTAYALGEVPPEECAAIEHEVNVHREIAAELKETREIARILRDGLRAEAGGQLAEHQRDAIFRAARIAQSGGGSPNLQPAPVILPKPAWWNRPGPWQAVAACLMVGFGIYVLNGELKNTNLREAIATVPELVVPVPMNLDSHNNGESGPNLLSPNQAVASQAAPSNALGNARGPQITPDIKPVRPDVAIEPLRPAPSALQAETSPAPPEKEGSPRVAARGPRVINAKNPELANNLAGADIGRARKTSEIEEQAVAVTKNLLQQAKAATEGSTYAEFAEVFRPVAGKPNSFEMIRAPYIRVDAEFAAADGQPLQGPPPPDARIKNSSNVYLLTE